MSPLSSSGHASSLYIIFTETPLGLPVNGMGSMVLPASPSFRIVQLVGFVQMYYFLFSLLVVPAVLFTRLATSFSISKYSIILFHGI